MKKYDQTRANFRQKLGNIRAKAGQYSGNNKAALLKKQAGKRVIARLPAPKKSLLKPALY